MRKAAAKVFVSRPASLKQSGRLEIRLFEHLKVALDGDRRSLWLHGGVAVSREYLAYLIYPDDEEDSARAKLRATSNSQP